MTIELTDYDWHVVTAALLSEALRDEARGYEANLALALQAKSIRRKIRAQLANGGPLVFGRRDNIDSDFDAIYDRSL